MRDDQLARLTTLAEEVADVFIFETDPQTWSGAGMDMADMDKQTRGDRYWCKKNAIQTGTLLARVLDLAERNKGTGKSAHREEEDTEKEIKRFEKMATDRVNAAQKARH